MGCDTNSLTADRYARAKVGPNGTATFSIGSAGAFVLCYRWNYRNEDLPGLGPTMYLPMRQIRLNLVTIFPDLSSPSGTTVGCATDLKIVGNGFDLDAQLPIYCSFLTDGVLTLTPTSSRNDTHIGCSTPGGISEGNINVGLDFGGLQTLPVFLTFPVINFQSMIIDSALPAGGVYNLELAVTLRGSSLANFGGARCMFGEFEGV